LIQILVIINENITAEWAQQASDIILFLKVISVLVFILFSSQNFYYGRTLSERPCYILPMFFIFLFIPALVGQTAERIFTKLSHVVDIRHHLRTY